MLRGDRVAESDSCSILAREKTRDYLQQAWLEDPLQPIRESESEVPAPTDASIRFLSLRQKQWARHKPSYQQNRTRGQARLSAVAKGGTQFSDGVAAGDTRPLLHRPIASIHRRASRRLYPCMAVLYTYPRAVRITTLRTHVRSYTAVCGLQHST